MRCCNWRFIDPGLGRGNTTLENKEENYHLADEFINRFQEQHGTILCRELIGQDLSTPEGLQNARDQKLFESVCPGLVKDAAELVADFLDE